MYNKIHILVLILRIKPGCVTSIEYNDLTVWTIVDYDATIMLPIRFSSVIRIRTQHIILAIKWA